MLAPCFIKLLFLFLALMSNDNFLTTCQNATTGPGSRSVPTNTPLHVGFVYQGAPSDLSLVYITDMARVKQEDRFGKRTVTTHVSIAKDLTAESFVRSATWLWEKFNCTLIFGASVYYLEGAKIFTQQNPNVKVVVLGGSSPSANVSVSLNSLHEVFFLEGMLAAYVSKTRKAAIISVSPNSNVVRAVNAFAMGAEMVDPKMEVYCLFVGGQRDELRFRRGTDRMIAQYDIDTFTTTSGLATVAQTATQLGRFAFGYPSDINRYLYGENVISSCVSDLTEPMTFFINNTLQGKWIPNFALNLGMADGLVQLGYLSSLVTAEAQETVTFWQNKLLNERYCIFKNDTLIKKLYNSSDFQSNGCLKTSLLLAMNRMFPKINVGYLPEDAIYEYVYVDRTSTTAIVLTTLVVILCVGCLIGAILVFYFRRTMMIVATNEKFCYCVLLGSLIGYIDIFFWFGEPTDQTCHARVWFIGMAFLLILPLMGVKTARLWRIWENPDIKESGRWNSVLTVAVSITFLIQLTLLSVLTGINGYQTALLSSSDIKYNQLYVNCRLTNGGVVVMSLIISFDMLLILIVAVFAYLARNVSEKFNETPSMTLSIYSLVVAIVVIILLFVNTKTDDPGQQVIFISCGIFIAITAPLFFLFTPKFMVLISNQRETSSSNAKTISRNQMKDSA